MKQNFYSDMLITHFVRHYLCVCAVIMISVLAYHSYCSSYLHVFFSMCLWIRNCL